MSDKLLLKTQEPQGNRAEQGTDDPKQNVSGEHGVESCHKGLRLFLHGLAYGLTLRFFSGHPGVE